MVVWVFVWFVIFAMFFLLRWFVNFIFVKNVMLGLMCWFLKFMRLVSMVISFQLWINFGISMLFFGVLVGILQCLFVPFVMSVCWLIRMVIWLLKECIRWIIVCFGVFLGWFMFICICKVWIWVRFEIKLVSCCWLIWMVDLLWFIWLMKKKWMCGEKLCRRFVWIVMLIFGLRVIGKDLKTWFGKSMWIFWWWFRLWVKFGCRNWLIFKLIFLMKLLKKSGWMFGNFMLIVFVLFWLWLVVVIMGCMLVDAINLFNFCWK